MAEALVSRITAWEKERDIEFTYDGVKISCCAGVLCCLHILKVIIQYYLFSSYLFFILQVGLLSMVEEYIIFRQEKEQERKRQRVIV